MNASLQERAVVPLKMDGVYVGTVMVDEQNSLQIHITARGTASHLRELLLESLIEGVSLDLDYVEPPENHVPSIGGHLIVVREN